MLVLVFCTLVLDLLAICHLPAVWTDLHVQCDLLQYMSVSSAVPRSVFGLDFLRQWFSGQGQRLPDAYGLC